MTRYIRFRNARMTRNRTKWYLDNTCPACGRVNSTGKLCEDTRTCKLCGMVQCGGSGGCRFCYHGLLAGYSGHDKVCDYAKCDNERVARGKHGKRYVCREHFIHQFGSDAIPDEIAVGKALRDFSYVSL